MGIIDNILSKVGLRYEDLTSAERETLIQWSAVLDNNQMDVETAHDFIRRLKDAVQSELESMRKETPPPSWLSIGALFIPFYGLVKKWYQDERRIYLEARLRNLMLLEAFFLGPKKARASIDRALAGMVSDRKRGVNL